MFPSLKIYGRDCSWATPKLWAWLCLEPTLLKFLEITTAVNQPFLFVSETTVSLLLL